VQYSIQFAAKKLTFRAVPLLAFFLRAMAQASMGEAVPSPQRGLDDDAVHFLKWLQSPESLAARGRGVVGEEEFDDWVVEQNALGSASSMLELECNELEGTRGVTTLPASLGRDAGLRSVTAAMLEHKGQQLFLKKAHRSYDVAYLAVITDVTPNRVFYIDSHQRCVVLQLALYFYYKTEKPLPEWLRSMAAESAVRYVGRMTLAAAKADALARAASMENGISKISWLDTALDAREGGESYARSVDTHVKEKCPEHYAALKTMLDNNSWLPRVTLRTLQIIETAQEDSKCAVVPFKFTWMRDTKLLLEGARKHKAQEHCAALEQELAVAKMLMQVQRIVKSEGGSMQSVKDVEAAMAAKDFRQDGRCRQITTAKKIIKGIEAAAAATGRCYDDLLNPFISGEFDSVVYETRQPELKGRFWPFVKEHDQLAETLANQRALEAAASAVEEAEKEVHVALENAAAAGPEDHGHDQEVALKNASIKERMSAAYYAQLRAVHASLGRQVEAACTALQEQHAENRERDLKAREDAHAADTRLIQSQATSAQDFFKDVANSVQPNQEILLVCDLHTCAVDATMAALALGAVSRFGGACLAIITTMRPVRQAKHLFALESAFGAAYADTLDLSSQRFFLSLDDGNTGTCLIFYRHDSTMGRRIDASMDAASSFVISNLPQCPQAERILETDRRFFARGQRGAPFYLRLFREVGALSALASDGFRTLDFAVVEVDAGVGDVFNAMRPIWQAAASKPMSPGPWWIGCCTFCAHEFSGAKKRRLSILGDLAKGVKDELQITTGGLVTSAVESAAPYVGVDAMLAKLAALPPLPQLPPPPKSFVEFRSKIIADPTTLECMFAGRIDHGNYQVLDANAQAPGNEEDLFLRSLPPRLYLLKASLEAQVLVAPSVHVRGENGIVPTKDFVAGEEVFGLDAGMFGWEAVGPTCPDTWNPRYTLHVKLQKLYRRDTDAFITGDPGKHVWANLNSSFGLGESVKPNLELRWAPGGKLTRKSVTFHATRDIKAFKEELFWDYGLCLKACAPEASPQVPQKKSPAPLTVGGGEEERPLKKARVFASDESHSVETSAAPRSVETSAESAVAAPTAAGTSANGAASSAASPAPSPPRDGTELAAENPATNGARVTKVADVDKPPASIFIDNTKKGIVIVHLNFENVKKIPKQVPAFIIYTAIGGRTGPDVVKNSFPYNPLPKTKIVYDGAVMTITDALGKTVKRLYGKGVVVPGPFPKQCLGADNSEEPYFWEPRKEDAAIAAKLVECKGLTFHFVMEVKQANGQSFLSPAGIAFMPLKAVKVPEAKEDGEYKAYLE